MKALWLLYLIIYHIHIDDPKIGCTKIWRQICYQVSIAQAKLDKVFICQHFMTLTFIRINSKVYVVVHLKSMWTPIWFTNYNNNYNAKINPNFLLTQKNSLFVSEYVIHWLTDKEKGQKMYCYSCTSIIILWFFIWKI